MPRTDRADQIEQMLSVERQRRMEEAKAVNAGATPVETGATESAHPSSSSVALRGTGTETAPSERIAERLEQLTEKWRRLAKMHDGAGGRWQAVANTQRICADEVSAIVAGSGETAPAWQTIETAPKDCTTILTQHVDDLYPVAAFCALDGDGTENWYREIEGPEDEFDGPLRDGKMGQLYRRPTHWMPLPPAPAPGA